jgi:hypothetical protein
MVDDYSGFDLPDDSAGFSDLVRSFGRFNQLRRIRNKSKSGGMERPFSRMHNFYMLKPGEKWARTGTRFRPRDTRGFPNAAILDEISEVRFRLQQ